MKERRKRRWLCGSLEWSHGRCSMVPLGPVAAVAMGQVTSRALTSRGCCHLLLIKEGGEQLCESVHLPSSLHPLRMESGKQHPAASFLPAHSPARLSLCPGLRAMYQICLCPPRHSHCLPLGSLLLPRRAPHPPLVRAEAIYDWVFVPYFGPRSKLLLFSLPFLPREVARQFPG